MQEREAVRLSTNTIVDPAIRDHIHEAWNLLLPKTRKMGSTPTADQLRIFVFDSPRTCSQLFNKLFAVHPQLNHVFHPLMGASMYGPQRVTLRLKHSAAAEEAQQELAKQINLPNETYEVAAARVVETSAAIVTKVDFDHTVVCQERALMETRARYHFSKTTSSACFDRS
jgi:hypothetical protein